jgi:hypothetical protein
LVVEASAWQGDRVLPRLIASDVDGTLIDSRGRLSARTRAALEAVAQRGVYVALASGRYRSLAALTAAQAGPAVTHGVVSNGSVIVDYRTDQVIDRVEFPVTTTTAIITQLRRLDPRFGFALQTEDHLVYERDFMAHSPMEPVGDEIDDVLNYGAHVTMKLWVFHRDQREDDLLERLPALLPEGLGVGHTGLDAVEVGPPGLDKADGVARLARLLGVARRDVLVFGDNRNDRTMLAWAGHSVAMGNADVDTQACAHDVTASNDDDGVARYLERLLAP